MDYKTKPISRDELRIIAKAVRQAFGCKNKLRFDVIDAFERASSIFPFMVTTVVDDSELPDDIPARCTPDFNGNYIIEVKNSIYEGAVDGVGGYRGHILHEICHGILCFLGFTPILELDYHNEKGLSKNGESVLHIHEYSKPGIENRLPARKATAAEIEHYRQYLKGVTS